MGTAFFPNPYFGWAFVAVLATMLVFACVSDWRSIRIPKWISLGALALGLLFHVARGAWLGEDEQTVWLLTPPGPVVGAIDATLFALCGGLISFVLMFGLFAFGGCGGGDVKLFAAVGVWVGAFAALWVFVIAAVVLMALGVLRLSIAAVTMGPVALARHRQGNGKGHSRWMTFSFPLTVGTMAVLWYFLSQQLTRA
jgi:Flp pilus assembly protein protease CpaA